MFSDELLAELLRIFNNSALDEVGGDIVGRIYEYFLNKFAKNIAQDDGVFFTPKSLVKMIVNALEPTQGIKVYIDLKNTSSVASIEATSCFKGFQSNLLGINAGVQMGFKRTNCLLKLHTISDILGIKFL